MTAPPPPKAAPLTDETLALFEDFDLKEVFDKAKPHAESFTSLNFVVEFGPERARIAFDLDEAHFRNLISSKQNEQDYPIRWINIWNPNDHTQVPCLEVIGKHYNFSERLIGLMALPAKPRVHVTRRGRERYGLSAARPRQGPADVEAGIRSNGSGPVDSEKITTEDGDDDNIELYRQVKDTVNYFSTDQTPKALCIGAHWLHKRPKREHEDPTKSCMPPKHWQWLTLCNDHTVLSIHEKASLESVPEKEDKERWHEEELRNIRANTLDVLLQLSKQGFDLYRKKPLSLNSVRRPLSKWHEIPTGERQPFDRHETGMSFATRGEPVSLADEGTSNLFYYLFEDYVAAGPLKIAERKLEQMTVKVLESGRPKIRNKSGDIIPTLHYLSKDLREMKHLFENYKNLISKLTAPGIAEGSNGSENNNRKVLLTGSALSRFERLGDRLQFLMLNSIEGYLEEISALSSTYFNLTQQKDSEATARLTRSATLLAKLSVFFLPIGFLTSYFSIQIADLYEHWTATDYWYPFAVVASVSFVSLFFFSRLLMFASDTLDGWAIQISNFFARRVGIEIDDED
ncbi:hypothetical protein F5Y16DRAFT_416459 [Xylariaceae sp. FL0255]|nr:hypothetical protein F5Y16DRAFT_416459 [Xylariaceae sp. FL0255]